MLDNVVGMDNLGFAMARHSSIISECKSRSISCYNLRTICDDRLAASVYMIQLLSRCL